MTDLPDIKALEAARTDAHALRDSYRREFGIVPGDTRLVELDDAVEAADISFRRAKQAQSATMNALSPDEYTARKRAFLSDIEHAAWLKRQRS